MNITETIKYIGVNDHNVDLFEGLEWLESICMKSISFQITSEFLFFIEKYLSFKSFEDPLKSQLAEYVTSLLESENADLVCVLITQLSE